MVEVGRSLSALPPRPLELSAIEELSDHDQIVTIVPLVPRGTVNPATVSRALVQLRQMGVVLEYDTLEGWVIQRTVSATDKSDTEVFHELIREAIDWQQERDGLVTALFNGRHHDLRDLLDDPL